MKVDPAFDRHPWLDPRVHLSWHEDGLPGQAHDCPARFVLEGVHGIDSTRFQEFANQLDTRKDQRRATPEYRFS
jgi:hypothetical protein